MLFMNSSFSADPALAMTRQPESLASWMTKEPTGPPPAVTKAVSPCAGDIERVESRDTVAGIRESTETERR
jgi:hypothetical protein